MADERIWTAALLVIGDEILSGRTQDRNIAQVGTWLNLQGIRLAEVRVVPDDIGKIAAAVNALRSAHDYLFTTGGIGPTHDDITVDAIAAALDVPVIVHPKARAMLEAYYETRGGAHRGAAPDGAGAGRRRADREPHVGRAGHPPRQHLHPRRRAAHRRLDAGGAVGPAGGRPPARSRARSAAGRRKARSPSCSARPSARIADCQIGSYPFFREGRVGANFVIRSTDEGALEACASDLLGRLQTAGRDVVPGEI